MKELRITMRVRNNRLLERREALGFTQAQLAKAAGITKEAYCALEGMRITPTRPAAPNSRRVRMVWRDSARQLASFYDVEPEELFPEAVVQSEVNRAELRVDLEEARAMMTTAGEPPALPSDELERKELHREVNAALAVLSPREQKIIRARFGLDGDEKTLDEIAARHKRCRQRIVQITDGALVKIRERLGGKL